MINECVKQNLLIDKKLTMMKFENYKSLKTSLSTNLSLILLHIQSFKPTIGLDFALGMLSTIIAI